MDAESKCPKCGSPAMQISDDRCDYIYRCGTIYEGGYCISQSPACYRKQQSARAAQPEERDE